jgi:hypothetical protein
MLNPAYAEIIQSLKNKLKKEAVKALQIGAVYAKSYETFLSFV